MWWPGRWDNCREGGQTRKRNIAGREGRKEGSEGRNIVGREEGKGMIGGREGDESEVSSVSVVNSKRNKGEEEGDRTI